MSIDSRAIYQAEVSAISQTSIGTRAPSRGEEIEISPPVALCRQEISRKIWHMSAGLLPFVIPLLPNHGNPAAYGGEGSIRLLIVAVVILLTGLSWAFSDKFVRPGEGHVGISMGCYVLCVSATLFAFPAHFELGMTVLAILAIGDGAAGLVGMTLGGPRLPWNPAKTVTGTLGFVLFAIPVASVAYWFVARPEVSLSNAFTVGSLACVVAAIAESWQSSVNDNLRVGLAAAMVLVGHYCLWLV